MWGLSARLRAIPARSITSGVQLGTGVQTSAVYRIISQGNLVSTENTLDLAIQKKGHFQVELPSGDTAYTRAGSFFNSAPNGRS